MNMLSFVPEYEKMTGDKLSEEVLNFIKDLDTYGKRFEKKGIEDSARGLPVPTDEAFASFGHKVFDDDPEMADKMSYLMKSCYMEGYEAVNCS